MPACRSWMHHRLRDRPGVRYLFDEFLAGTRSGHAAHRRHDFDQAPLQFGSERPAAAWRPVIETCIGPFGARRCMIESSFPVGKSTCAYPVLWNASKRLASAASDAEKASLSTGTAARVYRLLDLLDGLAPDLSPRSPRPERLRSNGTHALKTGPDARLARKSNGQASKLCRAGHVAMENRHGLAVAAATTRATGTVERDAGETMVTGSDRAPRSTLGADRNYDTRDFVAAMRGLYVTPHVAQHTNGRRSTNDGRTTRHPGCAVSQRIGEISGWGKEVGGMRLTPPRGPDRVGWSFTLRVAACNLIRLPKLLAAPA